MNAVNADNAANAQNAEKAENAEKRRGRSCERSGSEKSPAGKKDSSAISLLLLRAVAAAFGVEALGVPLAQFVDVALRDVV